MNRYYTLLNIWGSTDLWWPTVFYVTDPSLKSHGSLLCSQPACSTERSNLCKLFSNSLGLTQVATKHHKSSFICKIGQGCKNTLKNIFGNEPSMKFTALTLLCSFLLVKRLFGYFSFLECLLIPDKPLGVHFYTYLIRFKAMNKTQKLKLVCIVPTANPQNSKFNKQCVQKSSVKKTCLGLRNIPIFSIFTFLSFQFLDPLLPNCWPF